MSNRRSFLKARLSLPPDWEVAAMTGPNKVYRDTRYGPYFVSNRHDQFFDRALEQYGEWSWLEVELWRDLVEVGDCVITAGVNCGCHLVALGQLVGPRGTVIGFEPQLPLWRLAVANTVLCNVDGCCRVLHAALGPQDGQVLMPVLDYQSPNSFGGLSILHTEAPEECKVAVPLMAIDSLNLERCDFIQLDVEGMELVALQGARRTLAAFHPLLYLEAHFPKQQYALYDFLRREGYEIWWHAPTLYNPANLRGSTEDAWPDTVSISWVAVHRDREVPPCVEPLRPLRDGDWEEVVAPPPADA